MAELDENKVWIDGCFDFTHHGHAGAILQARQTIDLTKSVGELYCGVHNDKDIEYNKGTSPVMNAKERYAHTRSNRWCDHIIENAPYVTESEWLDKYNCKYVVHGDDITLAADGNDCYQRMKDIGRFKVVKRTPSVSTTEIIHRMLSDKYKIENVDFNEVPSSKELQMYCKGYDGQSDYCNIYKSNLNEFIHKGVEYKDTPRVLCEGDFDLFHIGHIEQLQRIKEDLHRNENIELIISVVIDNDKEKNVMTMKERILSLLSCKYVDGVIVKPKSDLLKEEITYRYELDSDLLKKHEKNEFQYLNKQVIIDRIKDRRKEYIARNKRKGMSM